MVVRTATGNRCPACWSALAPGDDHCSECGHVIQAPRGRWLLAVAAVTVIALGGALWWSFLRDRGNIDNTPAEQPPPTAGQRQRPSPDPPRTTPQPDQQPPRQTSASRHVLWVQGNERAVALLRVTPATPGEGALVCVPLDLLPRRGPLTLGNLDQIDAEVVTVDWQRRLVLLVLPASAVANTVALPVGSAASLTTADHLTVRYPRWPADRQVTLAARLGGAIELRLDARLPEGAVLLFGGSAVAYALGGNRALPLDPILPWLRRADTTQTTPLADLQKQVRRKDPNLILEDAGALLARRPATLPRVEEALAMLEQGQHLAGDATSLKALADLLAQAHHQRIRIQSRTDPVQALVLAKEAMVRFPDHGGILADVVLLTLDHGDPAAAAGFYEQLLRVSSAHATAIAGDVALGLVRAARSRQRSSRNQEALELATRAVQLFPRRADLHLAHARALAAAGRPFDALAAANEAARLDPSYAQQATRYEKAALRSAHSRTYVIPYDPRTRLLKAKATVGGQSVRFLVDTGASLTTIPTALADRLGLRKKTNPRTKVTTASGVMEVEVVELPSLRLGRIRLGKIQAAVLDLPGKNLAGTGLLGLNALRELNMEIDSENSRLVLKQRRKRR